MQIKKKTLLSLFMIICLFFSSPAVAETKSSISDFSTYQTMFNIASLLLGTDHMITSDRIKFITGEVNDVYQIIYKNNTLLQINVPHGTDNVIGVLGCYVPEQNASNEDVKSYLFLIYEILYATGVVDELENASDVLSLLGYFENLEDGDNNKITLNGLSIGYMVSNNIGFWFFVEI